MKIEIEKTERGFQRGEFRDANGHPCSIQQSSTILTDEGFEHPGSTALWLGMNGDRMHLGRELATELHRLLGLWIETGKLTEST